MFFIGGVPFVGITNNENQRKLYFSLVYMKLPSYNLTGCVKENLNLLFRHVQMIRVLDSDLCHKRADKQKEGLYISHGAPDPKSPSEWTLFTSDAKSFRPNPEIYVAPEPVLYGTRVGNLIVDFYRLARQPV